MQFQHFRRDKDGQEVEAIVLSPENVDELECWTGGLQIVEHDALDHEKTFVGLNISTPDGMRRASEGDFVIHKDGYWFVCKPGFFLTNWQLT